MVIRIGNVDEMVRVNPSLEEVGVLIKIGSGWLFTRGPSGRKRTSSSLRVIAANATTVSDFAKVVSLMFRSGEQRRYINSYLATGKSVFFSVNSMDACVFSQLMRMVQLPPV